jgi:hypothetical protein
MEMPLAFLWAAFSGCAKLASHLRAVVGEVTYEVDDGQTSDETDGNGEESLHDENLDNIVNNRFATYEKSGLRTPANRQLSFALRILN